MTARFRTPLAFCVLGMVSVAPQLSTSQQQTGSKTWVGRYQEIEEYLRTAECDAIENLGPATSGTKRCVLRAGGPVSRLAWRPDLPGVYRGFRESYKTNIAAYEIDKLLKLEMVPPTVERELQGLKGSATLWVENTVSVADKALPPASEQLRWERQHAQRMMFDALIGNKDRNLGNILRDQAWNMILIDHTRAFATDSELPHELTRHDPDLWARIEKLTGDELTAVLRPWLDANEIAAILGRRDRMRTDIKRRAGEALPMEDVDSEPSARSR